MRLIGRLAGAAAAAVFAMAATAAVPPYVQIAGPAPGATLAAATCTVDGPTPTILVNADLRNGATYRYSPAYVVPNYFDDDGEFNLLYNQDATLFVGPYAHLAGTSYREPLDWAPPATWLAAFGRLPEHTELALRIATYDEAGRAVAMTRITWDCTTGQVTSLGQQGNARGEAAPTARVIEYHHAALDHWFMTSAPAEIARLDAGELRGWQRTGQSFAAYTTPTAPATAAVCRFYLPPAAGDSHFYAADARECGEVTQRFPSFVLESSAVFHVAVPDNMGACPETLVPLFRLWNARPDSNHRYVLDTGTQQALVAQGYVAEGSGPTAVTLCVLP